MSRLNNFPGYPCPMKIKRMKNFQHYNKLIINMKIFDKYVAIAMDVRRNYMDALLQNISHGYKVILVLQPKLSHKTCFCAHFNNHVTSHVTHKIDEWPTA